METFDVVVIGAGLTGASAAWALSRRGHSVLVLEARTLNHREGSSHGTSRLFRTGLPDPLYAQLAVRALDLWREVEDQAGTDLLTLTGCLDFGYARRPGELCAAVRAQGIDCELLPAAAAEERWEGFRFPTEVMFHPDAGILDPEAAIRAMLSIAVDQYDAQLHTEAPVTAIEDRGGVVHVHTPSASFAGRRLIAATGPWLSEVIPMVWKDAEPLHVEVHEQNVLHFPQRDAEAVWPIFVCKGDTQFFSVASGADGGENPAIKVGRHDPGRRVTPTERDGVVTEENRALITDFVAETVPGLVPAPVAEDTGLYTTTRNDDFVIERRGPITVASPCSGQGAKFMPAVGEMLAGIAMDDDPVDPRFRFSAHTLSAPH